MPELNGIPATRLDYRKIINANYYTPSEVRFQKSVNVDDLPKELTNSVVDIKNLEGDAKTKALTFLFHTADCDHSSQYWKDEYQEIYSNLLNGFIDNFCPELLQHILNQEEPNYLFNPAPESIDDMVKNLFIIDVITEIKYQLADNKEFPKCFEAFELGQDISGDVDMIRQWLLTEKGLYCYADVHDWSFIKDNGAACY